ncbi:MAG: sigma-54-dependent Fis family transcriptional regulator [Acidobacteria bacterium]|nr:sigma-54-dependent Fis family transcriptional regulator [Acidobacteriota bacterium]
MEHSKSIQVVLAEDGRPARILLERDLPVSGRVMVSVKSGKGAVDAPRESDYDQALLDLKIPAFGRVESFHRRSEDEEGDVGDSDLLLLSAEGKMEQRLTAADIEPEAYDFLTKPLRSSELSALIRQAEAVKTEETVASILERAPGIGSHNAPVLGESPAMVRLLQLVERIASSTATVLLQGETGAGKGMVSRLIHELSSRREARFVAINCSAFQDQLLESELFGHEKGSFTGAVTAKKGLFEVADQGTLFLDEVAEMTPSMQAKLLQVLDNGELRRVGGTSARRVNARIIAATNKDLRKEVDAGTFREDLLFRLNVVTLTVPPLRKRSEEIPQLVEAFLRRFQGRGLPAKHISESAMHLLQSYSWPGNVRELANTIEGLLLLVPGDVIHPEDLPQNIRPTLRDSREIQTVVVPVPLTDVERLHIERTLRYTEGRKAPAARLLGIDVKTLTKKIRDYEIELPA